MLTLEEVLADVAASPGFESVAEVGINSRGSGGETPLHWMATLGDIAGVELLLSAGASVNVEDEHGNSALHAAVISRQEPIVRLLVDRGAQVCNKNKVGRTPLQVAEVDGYEPVIKLLRHLPL